MPTRHTESPVFAPANEGSRLEDRSKSGRRPFKIDLDENAAGWSGWLVIVIIFIENSPIDLPDAIKVSLFDNLVLLPDSVPHATCVAAYGRPQSKRASGSNKGRSGTASVEKSLRAKETHYLGQYCSVWEEPSRIFGAVNLIALIAQDDTEKRPANL